MLGIDDGGKRCPMRVFADVGILRPDELVTGDALTGGGHAGQAEIGGVRKDSCQ